MSQPQKPKPIKALSPQFGFRFQPEMDLGGIITERTGRDLFAGVTDPDTRKAAARIALIVNKLEAVVHDGRRLDAIFESIYGEPLRTQSAVPLEPTLTHKPARRSA